MKKVLLIACLLMINQLLKSQTINQSISFSGTSNSLASFGNINELNGVNQFSFEAWVYINQWNENSYIFRKTASTASRIDLQLGPIATKRLYFHVANGANTYAALDNSAINLGQWNHIVMAYDGTKSAYNRIRIYINGTQATTGIWYSSGNGLLAATTPVTTADFELGKNFNGKIDEVRLWNYALTASDIDRKNTINKYHPLYANLISYWKMDKNATSVINTKNNYNGTLSSASFSPVTDNNTFKYKIVSSYIRSNFYESGQISEEYIRNNNDIIYMATSPYANGDLFFDFPVNDGVLNNAAYMSNFDSRNGVMDFLGIGASMNCGRDLLNKANGGAATFSFASWVYIDQWVENSSIFRKYESATKNFDLQLGAAATNQLIFHLSNGTANYITAYNSGIATGGWHHVAVTYSGNTCAYQQVKIYVDGLAVPISYKNGDGLLSTTGPFIRSNFELGVNFDGKLDETSVSQISLSSGEINALMNNQIVVDTWNETKTAAYWKYDDASKPAKDSRTWISVLEDLKQTMTGYDGVEIRLGIIGGDWKTMIKTETARINFANKVKNIVETYGFDGVDLDFEWCATTQEWSDYSATILTLNSILGPTSNFSVTLHPLYYKISPAAIAALDYVSIQSYGPSPDRYPYNEFVNNVDAMLAYGFPAQKLIMGLPFYGVTTDNSKITVSYKGIVNKFPSLDPISDQATMDVNVTTGNGCGATSQLQSKSITYNGQQTIINKTKYVRDRELAGVMYWDMATDVDYTNQLSLLRALNSIMNANVQEFPLEALTNQNSNSLKLEHSIPPVHSDFWLYPNPAKNVFTVALPTEQKGNIKIFSLTGQQLFSHPISNQEKVSINSSNFKPGVYIIKFFDEKGNSKTTKLMIE
ncbi:T9SS type A sorting domain-containing protein [Flavobacterium sp. XN-5]|uniref:LamG-like jellyroll fold domain-containing protein n=1 Tax=Flavobacterium sp. XN-5 TaxID=2599390 RepID=UPI0013EF06D1|nr:LamG-like jellyroll fold domain-containing protein [Flavobacterium sp. XN-5]NGY37532.1 T9SS type A sorting domain-containing protein [Flavobacterium sp. XN-5]